MLFSISVLLLLGMSLGALCKKLHLPALTGMLITGIFLGPYALNLIDSSILSVSADLRKIALIIILIRAGLSLNLEDLKKVGRPAILMCFVPACFEMAGMILLAPKLLGISVLDAAIMGAVIAAVSPAVIVPNMVRLMEEGYGTKKGIPQLILAGASVDDVFVIVVFTAFTGLAGGASVSIRSFINIPVSILSELRQGWDRISSCGIFPPGSYPRHCKSHCVPLYLVPSCHTGRFVRRYDSVCLSDRSHGSRCRSAAEKRKSGCPSFRKI